MTPKPFTSSNRSVNISGNTGGVVVANGDHAQASSSVTTSGSPVDLEPIHVELATLRVQLAQLRESGSGPVTAEALAAAERDAEALSEQVSRDDPDSDEIARHLGRLSVVLTGVSGLADTLVRLTHSLGRLVGLG